MNTEDQVDQSRKRVLELRKGQALSERARKSSIITRRLMTEATGVIDWAGLKVAFYRSLPDEIDLKPLASELQINGAQLYYPKVVSKEEGRMTWLRSTSETQWAVGSFGIEEPTGGDRLYDLGTFDLIFVPGVLFGTQGQRIGMGVGFYDRMLARNFKAIRVSLAFDFQCEDNVPQSSWDEPMDWVLTELRSIRCTQFDKKLKLLREKLQGSLKK